MNEGTSALLETMDLSVEKVINLKRDIVDQLNAKMDEVNEKLNSLDAVKYIDICDHDLVVVYESGQEQNLGKVVGRDGLKGDKGDSIKGDKGEPGKDGTNGESIKGDKGDKGDKGEPGKDGVDGVNGTHGVKGEPGVGIVGLTIDGKGHLIVRLSDGRTVDAGRIPTAQVLQRDVGRLTGGRAATMDTIFKTQNLKIVTKESDFGTIVGDTIEVPSCAYIVTEPFEMDKTMVFPDSGIVQIDSTNTFQNQITHTGARPIFQGNPQRLVVKNLALLGNLTNTLFDMTAPTGVASTLILDNTSFSNFASLGVITNYTSVSIKPLELSNFNTSGLTIAQPSPFAFTDFEFQEGHVANDALDPTPATTALIFTGNHGVVRIADVSFRLSSGQSAIKFDNVTWGQGAVVNDNVVRLSPGADFLDPTGQNRDNVNISLNNNGDEYDHIEVTNPSDTQEVYIYRSGGPDGVVVRTVTINYNDSTKAIITSVERS